MRVVGDRILVRPIARATEINGFAIPDEYQIQDETTGTVVALGSGPVTPKGVRLDHFVAVGDIVVFSPLSGQELNIDGERVLMLREAEVLAVI